MGILELLGYLVYFTLIDEQRAKYPLIETVFSAFLLWKFTPLFLVLVLWMSETLTVFLFCVHFAMELCCEYTSCAVVICGAQLPQLGCVHHAKCHASTLLFYGNSTYMECKWSFYVTVDRGYDMASAARWVLQRKITNLLYVRTYSCKLLAHK